MRVRLSLVLAGAVAGILVFASPAYAPCHVVTFVGDPYGVSEGAGKVTITVSNGAGGQAGTFTVDYATTNDTAKAGSDFTQTSGTLELPPGQEEGSFQVPIINDNKHEATEDFMVKLSNGSGCTGFPNVDTSDTASVIIQDNDPKPQPSTSSAPTRSSSPRTTASQTPTPTPTPSKAAPPSASPSASPSATPTQTTVAVADEGGGGLSGGAVAGIVAAVVVLGGAGAFLVRRRLLS